MSSKPPAPRGITAACPVEAVFPDQSLPCLLGRGHEPPHKFTPDPCGQCGCLPDDPCCGSCAEPGCPCSEAGQDTATGTPDPVASALSGIRERASALNRFPFAEMIRTADPGSTWRRLAESAQDAPRLLAAVEAALGKAAEWKKFAASGDAQDECAGELREAIRAALLGKEGTRE